MDLECCEWVWFSFIYRFSREDIGNSMLYNFDIVMHLKGKYVLPKARLRLLIYKRLELDISLT